MEGVVEFTILVNKGRYIDMINKELFGRQLRELRQQQGLTQSGLARLLGIGRSTLSEVESGKYIPPVEVVVWLLKELNTSPEEWRRYGIEVGEQEGSLSGERAGAGIVAESPLGRAESEAVQRLLRLFRIGNKRVRYHLLHELRLLEEVVGLSPRPGDQEPVADSRDQGLRSFG